MIVLNLSYLIILGMLGDDGGGGDYDDDDKKRKPQQQSLTLKMGLMQRKLNKERFLDFKGENEIDDGGFYKPTKSTLRAAPSTKTYRLPHVTLAARYGIKESELVYNKYTYVYIYIYIYEYKYIHIHVSLQGGGYIQFLYTYIYIYIYIYIYVTYAYIYVHRMEKEILGLWNSRFAQAFQYPVSMSVKGEINNLIPMLARDMIMHYTSRSLTSF
jgi:hypothetical protein